MTLSLTDLQKRASRWWGFFIGRPVITLESLQSLAFRYGIEILPESEPNGLTVRYEKTYLDQLQTACHLILSELVIYSPSIVKASKLKRISFGTNLRSDGSPVGGLYHNKSETIYLSAEQLRNQTYARRAFHHELFHCIDDHDDRCGLFDPNWAKLNEKGFSYASPEVQNAPPEMLHRLGFMSNYAMSGVCEDKADLYAYMIVNYQDVESRAQTDPILKKKFLHMKELLLAFNADFYTDFWALRRTAAELLPRQETQVVTLKIWEEQVGGSKIWLILRKDLLIAKPLAIYSILKLSEYVEKLGIKDFSEMSSLYRGERKAQITVRVQRQTLVDLDLL